MDMGDVRRVNMDELRLRDMGVETDSRTGVGNRTGAHSTWSRARWKDESMT